MAEENHIKPMAGDIIHKGTFCTARWEHNHCT